MLSCIVAIDQNFAIGKNNSLPWHLGDDLQLFKQITSGHTIIMGRKTFDSIGRPLPNRKNIVISRDKNLRIDGCQVINNFEEIQKFKNSSEEHFIIGGSQIYKNSIDEPFRLNIKLLDRLYLTRVNTTIKDADDFFPKISIKEFWKEIKIDKRQPTWKEIPTCDFDKYLPKITLKPRVRKKHWYFKKNSKNDYNFTFHIYEKIKQPYIPTNH